MTQNSFYFFFNLSFLFFYFFRSYVVGYFLFSGHKKKLFVSYRRLYRTTAEINECSKLLQEHVYTPTINRRNRNEAHTHGRGREGQKKKKSNNDVKENIHVLWRSFVVHRQFCVHSWSQVTQLEHHTFIVVTHIYVYVFICHSMTHQHTNEKKLLFNCVRL